MGKESKKESKFDPWSKREKLYEEINRKRWSKAENIGKVEGIPEGWTLCDIGPKNAYIELSDEAIRKIDEDDIKGFWTEVCSLIKPEKLEYILTNTEAYHDFLIRGALMYCGRTEKNFILFIKPKLRTIDKKLKKWLKDREHYVKDQLYEGYVSVSGIISILEKDFFRIKNRIEAYFKTCLQNELKKIVFEKESVAVTPEEMVKKEKKVAKEDLLCSPRETETEQKIIEKDLRFIFKTKIYPNLTPRQKIIYERLKQGQKQKEIGDDLGISDRTVRNEFKKIKEKFEEAIK